MKMYLYTNLANSYTNPASKIDLLNEHICYAFDYIKGRFEHFSLKQVAQPKKFRVVTETHNSKPLNLLSGLKWSGIFGLEVQHYILSCYNYKILEKYQLHYTL